MRANSRVTSRFSMVPASPDVGHRKRAGWVRQSLTWQPNPGYARRRAILGIALRVALMLAACSLVGGPEPRRAGPSGPTGLSAAQAPQRGERRGGRYRRGVLETFRTDVPDHPYDIVLGNPTGTSVIASVLSYSPVEGYIEFGTRPGEYETRSDRIRLEAGKPAELTLDGLVAHTRYYYR